MKSEQINRLSTVLLAGHLGALSLAAPASADVVINEIMQNPSAVSDSFGEWIELYNSGESAVDIEGWTLRDDDFDSHVFSSGAPLLVPAGGFLVLGNNTDTTTNGGASVDYSYGSNWFIANGADEVVLQDSFSNEVDRVEYDGGPQFPDPTGASMALIDPALDNNLGENWCESTMTFGAGDSGTPGAANDCEPGGGGGIDPVARFIHEIQGSGNAVTEPGSAVIVEAVVIGDYQEADQLAGFFIQEESVDEDGDTATSEGILVFCGSCDTQVAEGNHVRVTGVQSEFFGMSQIDITAEGAAVEVLDAGDNLAWVTPVSISLPAAQSTTSADTFEAVEGMLVTVENELTVTEYFQLGRFGQVVLSEGGRLRQFTDASSPSVAGYAAHLEDISRRQIILDDLNNNQNVDPVFLPQPGGFSVDNVIRGGDTVTGLTAVMHWSWAGSGGTEAWRLRPQVSNPVAFDSGFDRPDSPDPVGGRLRVASFNVLNYFTTIDLTSSRNSGDCGPGATLDCRGADSDSELQRQTAKIVAAMSALDADIVGVIEIENNESESLESLEAALNSAAGEDLYTYVDTGLIGTDAIKVGLIYRPGSVQPVGDFKILNASVDPRFIDTRNRPVLIQTFAEVATGQRFTTAVNHLKSKGSACADLGDPDANDGQGNCNLTRTAAAQALVEYLATDPTDSGDADILIMGDINAYAMEDPITAIIAGGYSNLVEAFAAGEDPYSFVFSAQWGYLDHALASASLAPQVTWVTEWHINADEVYLLDYNDPIRDLGEASFEAKPASTELFAPDALRSSDHDPLLIGLSLAVPAESKNACKKGGWESLSRADGTLFKNQGDCIQYVNTGK